MPAVLATIAQQGQSGGGGGGGGGGGSTAPSIATSSSGNYNHALIVADYVGTSAASPAGFLHDGSTWSSVSSQTWDYECTEIEVSVEALNEYQSGSNRSIRIFGYLRNEDSGDNNPTWTLHSLTQEQNGVLGTLGAGATASLNTNSYNQYQDNTLSTRGYAGIGAYVNISAGGGRGGLTWGASGAELRFQVKATIGGDDCSEDGLRVMLDFA